MLIALAAASLRRGVARAWPLTVAATAAFCAIYIALRSRRAHQRRRISAATGRARRRAAARAGVRGDAGLQWGLVLPLLSLATLAYYVFGRLIPASSGRPAHAVQHGDLECFHRPLQRPVRPVHGHLGERHLPFHGVRRAARGAGRQPPVQRDRQGDRPHPARRLGTDDRGFERAHGHGDRRCRLQRGDLRGLHHSFHEARRLLRRTPRRRSRRPPRPAAGSCRRSWARWRSSWRRCWRCRISRSW